MLSIFSPFINLSNNPYIWKSLIFGSTSLNPSLTNSNDCIASGLPAAKSINIWGKLISLASSGLCSKTFSKTPGLFKCFLNNTFVTSFPKKSITPFIEGSNPFLLLGSNFIYLPSLSIFKPNCFIKISSLIFPLESNISGFKINSVLFPILSPFLYQAFLSEELRPIVEFI